MGRATAWRSPGLNNTGQLGDATLANATRYDHLFVPLPVVAGTSVSAALSLYPNPAIGSALLRGAAPGAHIRVLDTLGRLAATAVADASGAASFDLPTGLYLVRVGITTMRLAVE
ncbi:MAG: T9SS type A sorting domain-containing protein [Hymenobacter sp.]|nr:MAG: T9SS type A sorting domain-containing protein [Hymenobacter sp.]